MCTHIHTQRNTWKVILDSLKVLFNLVEKPVDTWEIKKMRKISLSYNNHNGRK